MDNDELQKLIDQTVEDAGNLTIPATPNPATTAHRQTIQLAADLMRIASDSADIIEKRKLARIDY